MDPTDRLLVKQSDDEEPKPRRRLRRLGRIGLGALGGAGLGLAYAVLGACPDGSCHVTSNPGMLMTLGAVVGVVAAVRGPS
ncbi:MAG: hypothetical protein DRI90_19180 [Deltaproteobacteria bacterium]|nr:MAG: hypothetical protein DRI90_19180 [Deltaproteobacteria bacterium]